MSQKGRSGALMMPTYKGGAAAARVSGNVRLGEQVMLAPADVQASQPCKCLGATQLHGATPIGAVPGQMHAPLQPMPPPMAPGARHPGNPPPMHAPHQHMYGSPPHAPWQAPGGMQRPPMQPAAPQGPTGAMPMLRGPMPPTANGQGALPIGPQHLQRPPVPQPHLHSTGHPGPRPPGPHHHQHTSTPQPHTTFMQSPPQHPLPAPLPHTAHPPHPHPHHTADYNSAPRPPPTTPTPHNMPPPVRTGYGALPPQPQSTPLTHPPTGPRPPTPATLPATINTSTHLTTHPTTHPPTTHIPPSAAHPPPTPWPARPAPPPTFLGKRPMPESSTDSNAPNQHTHRPNHPTNSTTSTPTPTTLIPHPAKPTGNFSGIMRPHKAPLPVPHQPQPWLPQPHPAPPQPHQPPPSNTTNQDANRKPPSMGAPPPASGFSGRVMTPLKGPAHPHGGAHAHAGGAGAARSWSGQGRGGGRGAGAVGVDGRPAKKSRKEREFDAACDAAMTAQVVVRAPANEEERKEIEKWRDERRRGYPTTSNLQRKTVEDTTRKDTGALDPRRQERMARLREVLALQKSMGLDLIAGTSDMSLDRYHSGGYNSYGGYNSRGPGQGSSGDGAGSGGTGAAGGAGGGADGGGGGGGGGLTAEVGREVAGGIATKFQWVRNGYVPPVSSPKKATGGFEGEGFKGGEGYVSQQQQQQQRQFVPRPRPPSLLHRLLDKDIRRDRSWLLQAIRFFVRNRFLQPLPKQPPTDSQGTEPHPTLAAPASCDGKSETDVQKSQNAPQDVGHEGDKATSNVNVNVKDGDVLGYVIDWPPEASNFDLAALLPPVPVGEDEDEEDEGGPVTVTNVVQPVQDGEGPQGEENGYDLGVEEVPGGDEGEWHEEEWQQDGGLEGEGHGEEEEGEEEEEGQEDDNAGVES